MILNWNFHRGGVFKLKTFHGRVWIFSGTTNFLVFAYHTYVPPFLTAVVFMLATSDPAPGSLTPRHAT